MEENDIKSYLDSHETIQFQVTREELDDPKKSAAILPCWITLEPIHRKLGNSAAVSFWSFIQAAVQTYGKMKPPQPSSNGLLPIPIFSFLPKRKGRP